MGSSWLWRSALLAWMLAAGAISPPVCAEEADAGTRVAARELAVAGAEAFDKQDFATALDRFQRAEQLYKAPSIAVMVARCLARVGRVVEAVDKYEETLRMPLDAAAPEAFQRAVADATVEVESARARVARLELTLPAGAPAGSEILLDDKPVPRALLGVPTPVDPGTHRIVARAPGKVPYRTEVRLAEGAHQALEVTLAEQAAARPVQPRTLPSSLKLHPSTLSIALLTGGGIATAVGAISGVAALSHKSTLDKSCSPGCPASMRQELDAYRFDRALSYVGFGLGIAGLGAGTYFLLHDSKSGSQVGASVFPNGAAVSGSF